MSSNLYLTVEPNFGETAQQATAQLGGINIAPNTPVEFKVDTSWTLYNGCINRLQLLVARLNEKHACLGVAETKRLLREAVNEAYYAALLSQLRMGIAEHNTKFNETLRDFVARRRKAGMASKSEMLNFQIKAGEKFENTWSEGMNTIYSFQMWENLLIYTLYAFLIWFTLVLPNAPKEDT